MTKMSRVLAAAVLVGATGIAAAPAQAFFGWFNPWNWTGGGYPYGWGGYPHGWAVTPTAGVGIRATAGGVTPTVGAAIPMPGAATRTTPLRWS